MKYIFIVQGEGRGHLTQALTLEQHLTSHGHEVVEILVGKSKHRHLPEFFKQQAGAPIARFESPNFLPSAKGQKNNITTSVLYNLMRLPRYAQSVAFIHRHIKQSGADVVVNFYELLTGLTYFFTRPSTPLVCIGHQYLFLHPHFKFPRVNRAELNALKLFTRITAYGAQRMLALSLRRMNHVPEDGLYVVPPLLRKEVLQHPTSEGTFIHGYMVNAGFAAQVNEWHAKRPDVDLRFFWDKKGETCERRIDSTLSFHPLSDEVFLDRMSKCKAYATTAGFESVCEALYMGKPVLMVPAHIEQECNAHDAMLAGAGIVSHHFQLDRLLEFSKHYTPDGRFIYWANNIDLTLEQLTAIVPTPAVEQQHRPVTLRLRQAMRLDKA